MFLIGQILWLVILFGVPVIGFQMANVPSSFQYVPDVIKEFMNYYRWVGIMIWGCAGLTYIFNNEDGKAGPACVLGFIVGLVYFVSGNPFIFW